MTRVRAVLAVAVAAVVSGLLACGDSPVDPGLPEVELVVVAGDGQYGAPGQRLQTPLQVLARRVDTRAPRSGLTVSWAVESGDASLVTSAVGTTDEDGLAEAVVLLGSTPGAVRISASLRDRTATPVSLEVHVAEVPRLLSLSASGVRGGDTLRLEGSGFSPAADQNVVLFSGIRGRVLSAAPTVLDVAVPSCLPARDVTVTTQLGGLVSDGLPLSVTEDVGEVLELGGGVPLTVQDDSGLACLRLPGGGPPYLVVVASTGTLGGGRYGYTLTGLSTAGAPSAVAPAFASPPRSSTVRPTPLGVAQRFERRLRQAEGQLVAQSRPGEAAPRPAAAAQVPSVGDKRTFKVLNAENGFDDVTAVARLVGAQAVLYVDQTAPAGGYTDDDLARFASDFDEVIFPTDTAAFGAPSDLDGNQRVVILFTPTVNRLTPRGSQGFVGGFFYGLDLQTERTGSNKGEIFYGMVPDPQGKFSDPRSRDQVLQAMPAILAHEFQHMIHFNQRVLESKATGTEALWLSEALAQMAEELVAREFLARGDGATASRYRDGNIKRARYYLSDPSEWSLIVATGQGSLEERGAGWLHALYLWDRGGGNEVLRRLTRSTKTGTENVATIMGAPWADVFSDWAASLYLDGIGNRPYAFEYPTVQLRDLLRTNGGYPLSPPVVGREDFAYSGRLWSSSAQHYIVVPPTSGSVALRLGGEAGGNAPPEAALGFMIVRLY